MLQEIAFNLLLLVVCNICCVETLFYTETPGYNVEDCFTKKPEYNAMGGQLVSPDTVDRCLAACLSLPDCAAADFNKHHSHCFLHLTLFTKTSFRVGVDHYFRQERCSKFAYHVTTEDTADANTVTSVQPSGTIDRIVFSVGLSADAVLEMSPDNLTLVFDDVCVNTGNVYNPSTGVFTVPEDGYYVFTADLMSRQGTLAVAHIMLNGNTILHSIYASGRNTGDFGVASGTVATGLRASDQIYLLLYKLNGYSYVMKGFSRFTGYKV